MCRYVANRDSTTKSRRLPNKLVYGAGDPLGDKRTENYEMSEAQERIVADQGWTVSRPTLTRIKDGC